MTEQPNNPMVPEGFHLIRVVVTDREFEEFRRLGALTEPGTPAAGLRQSAGLHDEPYGIQVARLRAAVHEENLTQQPHTSTDCWCGKSWDLTTHPSEDDPLW